MESLLNQTLGKEKLEIVLVDDGSPDDTYEKLQVYEQRAPETIMVIHCSENGGPGSARTIGLSYSTGEYVAFADQDDWVDLAMYQLMYEKGKEYDCDIVKCDWCREENTYEPIISSMRQPGGLFEAYSKEEREELLQTKNLGGYWAAIYKRNMLIKNKIFFPSGVFYDDNFFAGLVCFYGKRYFFCQEKMYHWYVNTESVSMKNNISRHTDRLKVELLLLEELRGRGIEAEFHDYVEAAFFERYFINTVATLITRQGEMPLSLWLIMRKQLFQNFPNFSNNPIIRKKFNYLTEGNWIDHIIQWSVQNIPELQGKNVFSLEYEKLKHYSFMELIFIEDLTQAQWELIQFCYMVIQCLR